MVNQIAAVIVAFLVLFLVILMFNSGPSIHVKNVTLQALFDSNISGNMGEIAFINKDGNLLETEIGFDYNTTINTLNVSGDVNVGVDVNVGNDLRVNRFVGIGKVPTKPLDVFANSTSFLMNLENSNAAGYASVSINRNNGNQVGGFGYGNANVAFTSFANKMYLFSVSGVDMLFQAGTGTNLFMDGSSNDLSMPNDNAKFCWGKTTDACIYWDNTSFIINPRETDSTANLQILSDVEVYPSADNKGIKLFGFDDRNTEWIQLALNGNGAPVFTSSTGSVFFNTALQLADSIPTIFGSVNQNYRFIYADALDVFKFQYDSSTSPRLSIFEVTDETLELVFPNSNVSITNDFNVDGDFKLLGLATFGATDKKFLIQPDWGGFDELPAGTLFGSVGSNSGSVSFFPSINALDIDDKIVMGYVSKDTTSVLSAMEITNVQNGFGTLDLMKSGGDVNVGGNLNVTDGNVFVQGDVNANRFCFNDGSGCLDTLSLNEKSWAFSSPTGGGATFYIGGHYDFGASDNDFNPSITFGTANKAEAAHAFVVCAAGASGGTDTDINVIGTSINDQGVRVAVDSQIISVDDAGAAGAYYETSKKWLGQITIEKVAGPDILCNYGFSKYYDRHNTMFKILGLEATWLAGANDGGMDISLIHHKATGWTYNAGSEPTPPTPVAQLTTDHGVDDGTVSGEGGAWKRDNFNEDVNGSNGEGTIIQINTSVARTFQIGNFNLVLAAN